MNDELRALWGLRGLDEEVAACLGSLARFGGERRDADARVDDERGRLQSAKQRLGEVQLKRRQLEKDVEALVNEERRFQGQLPTVKKNEEYSALLHEIANTRAKRSEVETAVLLQLDVEEGIQKESPSLERAVADAEREGVERRARADREEAEARGRLEDLQGRRRELVARLGSVVRSRYERVHASREGRAVVPIVKNSCGGCFRQQPPQTLQEARRGERVLTCEGCGRMLVWPPDAA